MSALWSFIVRRRMLLGIVLFLTLNHLIDWGPFNLLVTVYAQATQVTGQVKDTNGLAYAGAQISAQLVFAGAPVSNPTVTISVLATCKANGFGSAPCQVPFAPSNGPFSLDGGGNIPGGGITLQDNTQVTPSGTQWAFKVNTPGNPPPLGTGPQTCTATLTISGVSQSVSTSFSACPALSNNSGGIVTVASLPATCTPGTAPVNLTVNGIGYGLFYCPATNIWAPQDQQQTISPLAYGAKADTQICFGVDVSWNTGSNPTTITTSANCPFKPSDTGKVAFGTNGNGGALSSFAGTVTLQQSTLTYVSATTATVPVASIASCGPASVTCIFVWGSDDTTALTNAWAAIVALGNCRTLLLPAGQMLDQQPQFQTHDPEGCSPGGTGAMGNIYGASYTVRGNGIVSSIIVPTPGFNFAGCAAGGCFGGPRLQFFDWSIFGAANGATGAPSPVSVINSGIGELYLDKFSIVAWGGGDTNLTGITCAATCLLNYVKVMSGGSIGFSGSGEISNSTFAYSKTRALNVTGTINSVNNQLGFNNAATVAIQIGGTGIFNSLHDNIVGGFVSGNNVGVQATTGGIANLAEDTIVASGASTGRGVWANGGKIFARNTSITGGSAGGSAILQDTNGVFTDQGGNTYVNAFSFTAGQNGFFPFKSVAGSCTGTVTASLTTGGIYGTGPNISATACNAAPNNAAPGTLGLGLPMDHAGTLGVLQVSASAAGTNASSGLVTVMKNGVATTIICTVGTATSCVDNTHTVAFAYGDLITFQYTTQAADTLAGLKVNVGILN